MTKKKKQAGSHSEKTLVMFFESKKKLAIGRETVDLGQHIQILDWHHANGNNQSKTAAHFGNLWKMQLKQPLVSKWVKNEQYWRELCAKEGGRQQKIKWIRMTIHPEVEEILSLWVAKAMMDGLILTGETLCQKWKQFTNLAQILEDDRISLSEGWLTGFKNRVGLRGIKRHGKAASADLVTVAKERERVQELIKKTGYVL